MTVKGMIFDLRSTLVPSEGPIFPDQAKFELFLKLIACDMRLGAYDSVSSDQMGTMLIRSQLRNFFHCTVSQDESAAKIGSDEMFSHLAGRLGVAPKDCVVCTTSASHKSCAELAGFPVFQLNSKNDYTWDAFERFFEVEKRANGVISVLNDISNLRSLTADNLN